MRLIDKETIKRAKQVQQECNLPVNNRLQEFTRLEELFREVMAPDVPSYDVGAIQPINFTEWLYTEGIHSPGTARRDLPARESV